MSKKYVVGLLVLFAVIATSATFAFWAGAITGDQDTADGTVRIGEGDPVESTVSVGDKTDTDPLIPKSYDDDANNDVDLDFGVLWTADNSSYSGAGGTLTIKITDINIDGGDVDPEDIFNMFTITVTLSDASTETITAVDGTVQYGSITEGQLETVTINVEFTNQPQDQEEYDEVAGNNLVITFEFDVDPDDAE